MAIFEKLKEKYYDLLGKVGSSPTLNKAANTIGSIPQRTAQSFVNTAQFLTKAPVISDIGYKFPRAYAENQIAKPITQGVQMMKQPGLMNKGVGALSVAGGALSATPGGAVWNAATGAVAGAGRTLRTGQPLLQSAYQGVTQPTSVASAGLGVNNPYLAMLTDAALLNPKGTLKTLAKLRGVSKVSKFKMNSMDVDELMNAQDILTHPKQFEKQLTARARNPVEYRTMFEKGLQDAEETIRNLAQRHLPTKSLEKIGDDPIKLATELYKLHKKNKLGLFDATPTNAYFAHKSAQSPLYDIHPKSQELLKIYGKAKDIDDAAFISRDGTPIGSIGFQMHNTQIRKVGYLDEEANNLANYLNDTGDVRVIKLGGNVGFEIHKPITQNQFDEMLKMTKGKKLNIKVDSYLTDSRIPEYGEGVEYLRQFIEKPKNVAQGGLGDLQKRGLGMGFAGETRPPQTLNVNKLKVTPGQQAHIGGLEDSAPREVLKNKEVVKAADLADSAINPVTIQSTRKKLASQLASRQKVVSLEKEFTDLQRSKAAPEVLQKKIEEIARASKVARTEGTEAGRQLQARNILADAQATPMQKIFRLLDNAGVDAKVYKKDAVNVDFNNANEVVNFYRKFVPPTASEWVDVVRYNSMLSSPLTHASNIASNAINTGIIAPIEKTVTGVVDFLGSKVTGRQQTRFAGEGLEYTKGYYSKLGEASKRFLAVMKGKNEIKNLDLDYIPVGTTGKLGKKLAHLQIPTRLLEGMDQFFMALTEGGERRALQLRQVKGIKVPEIETTATANAAQRLFRSQTHDKRQGALLNSIDDVTDLISRARNADNPITRNIAKFTLPFIRTPMNILKQGIEYGPQGVLTLPGAKNKTEQLSKIMIGSSAMLLTEMMFESGRTTWAEPTDEKKRQAFRDAGLQPYSVKIGDNWVSYAKLPPALSFPMAIVSALHDAQENKTIDQSGIDVVLETIAKSGKFFADQSYLKNIGDLIGLVGKDPEKIASFVGNYPQQLMPWRALLSWTARLTDPYQRKVTRDAGFIRQQTEQFLMNLPFLSQTVPTRDNEFGEPIENQNRGINAVSPFRVSTEKPEKKEYYDVLKQKALMTKNKTAIKEMIERGEEVPANAFDVKAAEPTDEFKSKNSIVEKAKTDVIKTKLEAGLSLKGSELEQLYLTELNKIPESTAYEKSIKEDEKFSVYSKIKSDEKLTDEQKKYLVEKLGISENHATYYDVAKREDSIKYTYVQDFLSTSTDSDIMTTLAAMRTPVNGKMILSNGVIDELYDDGTITYAEKKELKAIKYDTTGKIRETALSGGGGRAAPKIVIPQMKPFKLNVNVKPIKKYKIIKPKKLNVKKLKV